MSVLEAPAFPTPTPYRHWCCKHAGFGPRAPACPCAFCCGHTDETPGDSDPEALAFPHNLSSLGLARRLMNDL